MSKSSNQRPNIYSNPSVYNDAQFGVPSVAGNYMSPDINILGYRSIEFDEPAEMLISGCSFTFGQGVNVEANWPSQLSEMVNMKHHNLALPGSGVGLQVGNIFSYIYKYGNPKIILCLFPEFDRMRMVSNRNFMIPSNDKVHKSYLKGEDDIIDYSYTYAGIHDIKDISKIPHKAEDVIPQELAFNISINYIKMLEMYCNSNGIIFLWSTWFKEQYNYIHNNINKMSFKNFIDVDINKWHSDTVDGYRDLFHEEGGDVWAKNNTRPKCTAYTDCHSELRDIYGKSFDYSSDVEICAPSHHWGAHRHRHMAEDFFRGLNEYNTRNK
jgi:hypothetical protein